MPRLGQHHSTEAIERIRQGNLGKKRSAETKARMSAAKKGIRLVNAGSYGPGMIPWNKGKSRSTETCEKISRKIKSMNLSGERSPSWKGGRKKGTNCFLRYAPDHLHATDKQKYIKEHRLIMEEALGRPLSTKEIIHHRNGNPYDNCLSNLQICTISEHMKIHKRRKS